MAGKLDNDIGELKGIGEKRREALAGMGINTLGDILAMYPRAYQNRGDTHTVAEIYTRLREGETGPFSVYLTIATAPVMRASKRGVAYTKVRTFDETGSVEITYFNQKYIQSSLVTGKEYRFYGKFTFDFGSVQCVNPVFEEVVDREKLRPIFPVYPISSGLNQRIMQSLVSEAFRIAGNELEEFLPSEALEKMHLPTYAHTVKVLHSPDSLADIDAARRRLVFDELYLLFLSVAMNGARVKRKNNIKMSDTRISEFISALPFALTGAQQMCINEILGDMSGDNLMNRILTGDVGSGKTAVAAAAAYTAVKNGYRVMIMAPTEILAAQHYEDFSKLFEPIGVRCSLLTGSTGKKDRARILAGLRDDEISLSPLDIIIGTHALLSDDVRVDRIGLAVIDEQHRFGVRQRAAFFEKASELHCLVMSATPIPRTLTLVAYGGIDVSRIDEMPAGRQKIDTFIVNEGYRERLNGFIRKQISEGHQVYVVCPAVEEKKTVSTNEDAEELSDIPFIQLEAEETTPIRAAETVAQTLSEKLPELKIGLVHGRMKSTEKDAVMGAFAEGNLDVLVSTTVIEVGVNVPNATLMIVENAERFGMSQLHQLRGRVGRGKFKSYFILVSDSDKPEAKERLRVLKSTNDGMEIAEQDLKQRGPGDFFVESGAVRQHGQMDFRLADSCRDEELISGASELAADIVRTDPELSAPEHKGLKNKLARFKDITEKTAN